MTLTPAEKAAKKEEERRAALTQDERDAEDKEAADKAAANAAKKNAAPDFSFALNQTKLNRAKAWVSLNMEVLGNPSGEALTKAIRTRYEALGGKVI